MNRTLIAAAGALLLTGAAVAQVSPINGSLGSKYPASTVFQTNATGFGDSTSGAVDTANGSELDGVFAQFTPGYLNILFTGNLESNFNKLALFFDVDNGGAGQNKLLFGNSNQGGLDRMSASSATSTDGLTFDAGFNADYFLTVGLGGGPTTAYVDYATLNTGGGGTGTYVGSTTSGANGVLSGGTNPSNLLFAWNNSNTGGVDGTNVNNPSSVTTGLEFAIPTSMIGNVNYGTGVRIVGFINGSSQDFISNQVLGGLPAASGNLGDPRNVNFSTIDGNQFFAVPEPASMAALAIGAFGLLRRRRK